EFVFEASRMPLADSVPSLPIWMTPPYVSATALSVPPASSVAGPAIVIDPPHPPPIAAALRRPDDPTVTLPGTCTVICPPLPAGTPLPPLAWAKTYTKPLIVTSCALIVTVPPSGPTRSPDTACPVASISARFSIVSACATARETRRGRRHRAGAGQSPSEVHAAPGATEQWPEN